MEENKKVNEQFNVEQINETNINQENNVKGKSLTVVLTVIVLVLILAIGVCVGLWFAGDTTKIINNKEEVVKEENKTSKKIDDTKHWVYDADYNNEKEVKTLTNNTGRVYSSAEELIVPFININSEYGKNINQEIQEMYEIAYSEFGKNNTWLRSLKYEVFENDNILSIVITKAEAVINGGAGLSKLYIYNFNLDTLNVATFEEMAKLCGFNSTSEVTDKISEWEKAQNDFASSNPDKVGAQMMGVVDGQYFIDSNKKLNFVYVSEAAGNYYTPAIVEIDKEIEDFYDMSNIDKPQVQKSIFDEADALNYTSNPTDDINGKIAVLKMGEKPFQTVMHDGYYTYTDNFSNSYNIKEITDITSEYTMTGNDNWANLFKCTVKYLDNNNKNKSFDIAVIVPTTSNEAYFMAPYDNYTGSTSFVKGFTDLYSYDYINEYFTIELPANWEFEYNVEEETLESGRAYTFMCKEHNKMLFKITVLTIKESEVANFEYIGTDGKLYYYLSSVVDGDVNSEHYDKLFENFNVLDSFYLVKTIKNEYGNGTQTKTITGKDFITIPGTSNRGYIYYIDRENNLCKTSLFDGFETKILANYVKNIELNSSDGEIHAYPIGDSFMNNIAMEDEFVVFDNVN